MPPPGWPAAVSDPVSPDLEASAVRWMLDLGPGEWRAQPPLTRYPLVLAFRLRHDLQARLDGARLAYSSARRRFADSLGPHELEAVLAAVAAEGADLDARLREVDLVADALERRAERSEG